MTIALLFFIPSSFSQNNIKPPSDARLDISLDMESSEGGSSKGGNEKRRTFNQRSLNQYRSQVLLGLKHNAITPVAVNAGKGAGRGFFFSIPGDFLSSFTLDKLKPSSTQIARSINALERASPGSHYVNMFAFYGSTQLPKIMMQPAADRLKNKTRLARIGGGALVNISHLAAALFIGMELAELGSSAYNAIINEEDFWPFFQIEKQAQIAATVATWGGADATFTGARALARAGTGSNLAQTALLSAKNTRVSQGLAPFTERVKTFYNSHKILSKGVNLSLAALTVGTIWLLARTYKPYIEPAAMAAAKRIREELLQRKIKSLAALIKDPEEESDTTIKNKMLETIDALKEHKKVTVDNYHGKIYDTGRGLLAISLKSDQLERFHNLSTREQIRWEPPEEFQSLEKSVLNQMKDRYLEKLEESYGKDNFTKMLSLEKDLEESENLYKNFGETALVSQRTIAEARRKLEEFTARFENKKIDVYNNLLIEYEDSIAKLEGDLNEWIQGQGEEYGFSEEGVKKSHEKFNLDINKPYEEQLDTIEEILLSFNIEDLNLQDIKLLEQITLTYSIEKMKNRERLTRDWRIRQRVLEDEYKLQVLNYDSEARILRISQLEKDMDAINLDEENLGGEARGSCQENLQNFNQICQQNIMGQRTLKHTMAVSEALQDAVFSIRQERDETKRDDDKQGLIPLSEEDQAGLELLLGMADLSDTSAELNDCSNDGQWEQYGQNTETRCVATNDSGIDFIKRNEVSEEENTLDDEENSGDKILRE